MAVTGDYDHDLERLRLVTGVAAYESGAQPALREVLRRLERLEERFEAWRAEASRATLAGGPA